MSRLFLAAPFLIVLSAAAQAPEDNRPPLFFREDWKEIAAVAPVTQEHVANPRLLLGLYGPGKDGVRKSHHDTPKDDPYYIWLGDCQANCAIGLRDKDSLVDLTGLAKVRWRTKQTGFRSLRLTLKLADGTWLVSDYAEGPTLDWHETEFSIAGTRWRRLNIATIVEGAWVDKPDLSKVDEIGWTELAPGGGTPASSRVDWIEVYGKPVPRQPPPAQVAQGRGAVPGLMRFCPGSGIPCVEITKEAYDRGHDQFRAACGFCHGPTAAGGNGGPNLIFSSVIRLDKGNDITQLIRQGRPDKGMPVVPLTDAQTSDIVSYLKARIAEVDLTSGRRPSRDYDLKKLLTGDADRGKAYFNGAGQCATCHSPTGDLKGLANKYPPIELQARFMYPSGPATKAAGADPLAKHRELLPKYTSAAMHDMFAYLMTLK